jgi:YesN/AraC family two-component response regulator
MKKILVIEDEARTRNLFLNCLKAEGFYTIAAENGFVGIQRAQEQLPDLVICDIAMPELDGYSVLTTLRQNPATAIIPFIFLTGKNTKAELRQGMELGADDYLTKPCTVEELLGAIAARLEKQIVLRQWCATECQAVKGTQPTDTALALQSDSQSIFPDCSPKLNKVFQFIEDNYQQPINLCDVAKAVGYSPAYLTNLVKRQSRRPVHGWIVERRMAEARSLLLKTDEPVNQIAAKVGYPDTGHFIRQFRQLHEMSPKVWRNAHCS